MRFNIAVHSVTSFFQLNSRFFLLLGLVGLSLGLDSELVEEIRLVHTGHELRKIVIELCTDIHRKRIEKALTFIDPVQEVSIRRGHIREITISALDTRKRVNVAVLKSSKNHVDIDGFGVGLNKIVKVFFARFKEIHNSILIKFRLIENPFALTSI